MAFCKYCQGELPEDSTLCPVCGRENETESEAAETVEATTQQQEVSTPEEAAAEAEIADTEDGESPAQSDATAEAEGADTEDAESSAQSDTSAEAESAETEDTQNDASAEENADAAEAEQEAPEKKSPVTRIIAGVLVLALLAGIIFYAFRSQEPAVESVADIAVYAVDAAELTPDSAAMDKVVAEIGDHALTNGVFQVYYWMQFYNMASMYGEYLSYMGLDTTIPFAEQDSGMPVNAEETYAEVAGEEDALATLTWEQYFIQSAVGSYREFTALADAATAAGMELSAEYAQMLDGMAADLQAQAEEAGFATADEFVQASFGTGVTVEDYIAYMQTYMLAATYANDAQLVSDYTEADVEAYYDANAEMYASNGIEKIDQNMVNVRHILIQPESDQDTDGDEVNDSSSEAAWQAAEQRANDLYTQWQEDPTEDNFAVLAGENSADTGSVSNGGLYEGVYPGQMVPEFNDWCFDAERQSGDTAVVKTDYGYHIMYFVAEGEGVYWYQTAEADYINDIYAQRLDEVIAPVEVKVNYNNVKVNSLLDMMTE